MSQEMDMTIIDDQMKMISSDERQKVYEKNPEQKKKDLLDIKAKITALKQSGLFSQELGKYEEVIEARLSTLS